MRILLTMFNEGPFVFFSLKKAFESFGHQVITVGPFPPGVQDISEPDKIGYVGEGAERREARYFYDAKQIFKKQGTFDAIIQVEPAVFLYNIGDVCEKSCYWSTDSLLHRRLPWLDIIGGGIEYMPQLKCNFYNKYGYKTTFERIGEPAIFLPLGVDPDICHPMETEKLYDVVFIGSDHPTLFRARDFLVEFLREKNYTVYKGHASGEEYCLGYAQGRLAFNYAINGEMGKRFFELMAMGACQLSNIVHGQELLGFQHEEHLINYNFYDIEHWVQLYKDDPESLKRIGQAAREKVLTEHTYAIRARQILEYLFD